MELIPLITGLATVAFLIGAHASWRIYDNLSVGYVEGKNNDHTVEELFDRLIRDVKSELIIHDDGDDDPTSMYNNARIVEAIRMSLEKNADLRVRMYFNEHEDLKVNALAGSYPTQVLIRYNPEDRPFGDIHYKIIDGGKQGHLSRHALGSGEREFEFFDCSKSEHQQRKLLVPYCNRFERDFDAAAAA